MRNIIYAIFIITMFGSVASAQSIGSFPIDIVWSADTYTPSIYKGKSLASPDSQIKLAALTPTQNANNLEFIWLIKDGSSLRPGADRKGRGLNTFTLNAERVIPNFTHIIEVIARNVFTGAESSARVEIPIVRPEVVFAEFSNSRIVKSAEDRLFAPTGSSLDIIALPLFFPKALSSDLVFKWKFDREVIPSSGRPDLLTLQIAPETPLGTQRSFEVEVFDINRPNKSFKKSGSIFIGTPN